MPPDEHAAHDVAEIAVDVGDAELLAGGSLLATVQHPKNIHHSIYGLTL